jgi:hypothetical protein
VRHSIETNGRPIFAKARRLDPEKHRIAEAEFRKLEKAGIVRRSNSPWSSPLHMVLKPDGSWRPCGDYRRLNLATKHDRYPLPSIMDLSTRLHGCRYLVKGYHQVPMDPDDIPKMAIITPFGLFEYLFMPFGLMNAAQTFQRLMDRLFGHLPFVITYLDDHLIASATLEEHLQHLAEFFQVLLDNGLTINPSKCTFAVTSVKFLGHMVSESGIKPLPRHVTAIQEFPQPTDIKQLQQFLGLVNFYRRFLPSVAKTLKPLTDLLRGSPKRLEWTQQADAAFAAAKTALIAAVPLSHPAPGATLALAVDASDTHVGATLQQLENRAWRPLAFFSRKLSPTECRYSTFDRELLAAFSAVRHFRFLLEGRQFRLLTDHKPLVTALSRLSPPWSARQQRQLAYLSEFTSDIRHTPGHANVVADALSRPSPSPARRREQKAQHNPPPSLYQPKGANLSAAALHANNGSKPLPPAAATAFTPQPTATAEPAAPLTEPLDFVAMAAAQRECPDFKTMQASPSIQLVYRWTGDHFLYGDVSTGVFRPFIPRQFRSAVILSQHNLHHPGIRATTRLVTAAYCWPHMGRTIADAAHAC